jgi:cytochrome b pre-mRNA-processing protein 3
VGILKHIFGGKHQRARLDPLYRAIVAYGRARCWYLEGEVPDTVDGRFDMIAAVLALVLIRLEQEEPEGREASVLLTEIFIDDMDGSLREIGIGDLIVGKHIGKMMGALGGRIGAFRAASGDLRAPVLRNIFHDAPPSDAAAAFVAGRLEEFQRGLSRSPLEAILAGRIAPA